MRRLILAALLASACCAAGDWGPLEFLVGRWTGDGGNGAFTFTPDVQGKVLVRKSFAQYPKFRHDDLTVVYREAGALRAIYFDNEDHVIRYAVKPAPGGVVFLSEGPDTAPRFRLTYTGTGENKVKVKFEIAPPGKDFATYIEATVTRD